MKKTYKYLLSTALSGLVCLSLALSASAQHRDNGGGGGGGGSRPSAPASSSGGGSRSSAPAPSSGGSRPSFNGGGGRQSPSVGVARPSFNGGSRSGSGNHVSVAPPRINSQGIRPPAGRVSVNPGVGVNAGSPGVRSYTNSGSRSYVGTRGYIGQGGRASVGVGGRGFSGGAAWRNHGYHYYHGYYNTYYGPRIGFSIGFLPYGYYPFYYGDYEYYYSSGLFYQYANNEYTVVEPPVGAEVNSLPSNAQSIVINGEQYYEANGVYYQPITKDDGTTSYQVAGKDGELNTAVAQDVQQAPQVGDIVDALPADCRKINLNGEKYYVSPDGYYYQEAKDGNGNKVYKIVGTPDDAPTN